MTTPSRPAATPRPRRHTLTWLRFRYGAVPALWLALACTTPRASSPDNPPSPRAPDPAHIEAAVAADGQQVPVEHHYLDAGAIRLHYVTAGPEDGHTVVLLHGFPEFWYGWHNQIVALAQHGYRVVVPDLRGFGASSKPEGKDNYTIAQVALDVVALLHSISPGEKVTLVGHDWGGSAAFRIAYDEPASLDRLFILNIPHPNQIKDVTRDPLHHIPEAIGMVYIGAFLPKGQPEFLFKDVLGFQHSYELFVYNPMVHKENVSALDRELLFESWRQPGVLTAATNYYRVNFSFPQTFPDRALPATLPVVLIFGMKDIFMSPSYAERIEACTVCAENLKVYRIPDASHFVQSDVPSQVNEILLKHLAP
jgi:pimeloyl-ACP methyl ester carboxylesterase